LAPLPEQLQQLVMMMGAKGLGKSFNKENTSLMQHQKAHRMPAPTFPTRPRVVPSQQRLQKHSPPHSYRNVINNQGPMPALHL
jgi:hypothetical protein